MYNGWTNFETFCCHLWLTNEESTYFYWNRTAAAILEESDGDGDTAAGKVADLLKEALTENMPEIGLNLYNDLLEAALQNINYTEVASAFLEK